VEDEGNHRCEKAVRVRFQQNSRFDWKVADYDFPANRARNTRHMSYITPQGGTSLANIVDDVVVE
jgi:hypothetical protein